MLRGLDEKRKREREKEIAPFSIEKSDSWKQLEIRDVFSIPRRDIRNYCLCFSSSRDGRIYPLETRPSADGADVVSFELFQPTPADVLLLSSLSRTEDTPIHDLSLVPGTWFTVGGSSPFFRFFPLT